MQLKKQKYLRIKVKDLQVLWIVILEAVLNYVPNDVSLS
jgi:predicted lipid carrier protein YhbT